MKGRKFMKRIITMLLLPALLLQTGLLSGPIMARAEGGSVTHRIQYHGRCAVHGDEE